MKLFRFRYINILRELIENNFPFSPEFGRPKASIFCSRGVPGRLDVLLAKSLGRGRFLTWRTVAIFITLKRQWDILITGSYSTTGYNETPTDGSTSNKLTFNALSLTSLDVSVRRLTRHGKMPA